MSGSLSSKSSSGLLCLVWLCVFLNAAAQTLAPVTSNAASNEVSDAQLQRAAIAALGSDKGTIIVLDPQNGRVRAVVNPPTAFGRALPPGSAIKPFVALAALQSGKLTPETQIRCATPYREPPNYVANCVHPRKLPPFDGQTAIAHSCNYFFGKLGEHLTLAEFRNALTVFGLGRAIGQAGSRQPAAGSRQWSVVSGQSENSQRLAVGSKSVPRAVATGHSQQWSVVSGQVGYLLPAACCRLQNSGQLESWQERSRPPRRNSRAAVPVAGMLPSGAWRAHYAIGDSHAIRVTPAQLIAAYAALGNGGALYTPQNPSLQEFIKPKQSAEFTPHEPARLKIAETHRRYILRGMRGAVTEGTARASGLKDLPLDIYGKTGTMLGENGRGLQGWFVGLTALPQTGGEIAAPSAISLAVLVYLPNGKGADAAARAREVLAVFAGQSTAPHLPDASTDGAHQAHGLAARSAVAEWPSLETRANALPDRRRMTRAPAYVTVRLRTPAGQMVTRRLSWEEYIAGVIVAEAGPESEREALKAQAIVARSYALNNLARHEREGYDFCTLTHCQRFAPSGRVRAAVRQAVRATRGQVLLGPDGTPAEVYYSASCGGMSSEISTLWPSAQPRSYLRGVADEACEDGPHATWQTILTLDELTTALRRDTRTDTGSAVTDVSVPVYDETGRALVVKIDGPQPRTVNGWDFKIIIGRGLGWQNLKSSRFTVERDGARFIFRGRGFGHGLGLCQEGAHVRAARGATYRQILRHYFPGTALGRE